MAGPRMPRAVRRFAPLGIGISILSLAGILAWFQARRDVDVLATLRDLDPRVLPAALALHMLSHLFWAQRIGLLGRGLGIPLGAAESWRLVTAGQFAGTMTPARMGTEAMRLTLLVRRGAGGVAAGRTVLMDRSTDMVFFVVLGALGALVLPQVFGAEAVALRGLAFLAAAGLLGIVLLIAFGLARPRPVAALAQACAHVLPRRPAVRQRVEAFLTAVREGIVLLARDAPWRLAAAAALTVAIWASEYGVLWVVLRAVGADVPLLAVLAAGVLLTMIAALPLSVGGAGISELAAVLLFAPWAGTHAVIAVLLWRAASYYYDVIVGGIVAAAALGRPPAPSATPDRA